MNIKQNMFDLACDESRRKSAWRVVTAESFPCLGGGNRSAERPRKAFTLIELLVVIAIIGILVSLLFPVISSVKESSKKAAARVDMQSIETAVDQYYAECRRMPIPDGLHKGTYTWNHGGERLKGNVYRGELVDLPGGGWHHGIMMRVTL